jgi:hypothetical protein
MTYKNTEVSNRRTEEGAYEIMEQAEDTEKTISSNANKVTKSRNMIAWKANRKHCIKMRQFKLCPRIHLSRRIITKLVTRKSEERKRNSVQHYDVILCGSNCDRIAPTPLRVTTITRKQED